MTRCCQQLQLRARCVASAPGVNDLLPGSAPACCPHLRTSQAGRLLQACKGGAVVGATRERIRASSLCTSWDLSSWITKFPGAVLTKHRKLGGSHNRCDCLPGLEAGSLRSRYWQRLFLLRAVGEGHAPGPSAWLAVGRLHFHMVCSLFACLSPNVPFL